ncbi:MAG: HEAT repeat domain-containing protein [Phycisphaerae bacterium]|mgnify:CR=1 FL=1|nr:HEAT repeat domain-containing protein [Phycisphaerae bacterium]
MNTNKELVRRLKTILNRYARTNRMDSDTAEVELDLLDKEVKALPRDGIVPALQAAVGHSKTRRAEVVNVLSWFTDIPEAVDFLGHELSSPDYHIRERVLGIIGHRKLSKLAPLLNDVITHDPVQSCRERAISVAAWLKQEVNFPAILQCAEIGDPALMGALVHALLDYGRSEGYPYLRRAFEKPVPPPPPWYTKHISTTQQEYEEESRWSGRKITKLFAAWGLAKLGDPEGIAHLGEMLYDPDHQVGQSYLPGQSLRAAQAMADVFNLPFEWNTSHVPAIREWWERNREWALSEGTRSVTEKRSSSDGLH